MSSNHQLLQPWMLRLSIGQMYPGQYGTDLIYNTRTKRITEWSRTGTQLWDQSLSRPVETAFAEVLQKFTSLEWVPHFDESSPSSRQIIENPICLQNIIPGAIHLPTDPILAVAQIRRDSGEQSVSALREEVNRWRSLQRLYQDYGWNTERYNPTGLETARREWFGRLKQLDRQGRLKRCMSEAQREELRVAREEFGLIVRARTLCKVGFNCAVFVTARPELG